MDKKTQSALEKIITLRKKGAFAKALKKLDDLIRDNRSEVQLYLEAVETCLDGGDPLKAWEYVKRASGSCPSEVRKITAFSKEKVHTHNDPVFARLLMERFVRDGDLDSARQVAQNLDPHSAGDLLRRVHMKRKTLLTTGDESGSFREDLRVQTYCEAILNLRTGRSAEAAGILVELCDGNGEEAEFITPFLEGIGAVEEHDPGTAYALGCCYLQDGRYTEALDRFLFSARASRSFLEPIIERLERLRELDTPLPRDFDLVLCELYMLNGELQRATELISHVLEDKPSEAAKILDLLDDSDPMGDHPTILDLLYIEAAILAKINNAAIKRVKALSRDEKSKEELLDWLDEKRSQNLLPSELLVLYGDLALEANRLEKGIDALRDAVEMSPVDTEYVLAVLDKHTGAAPEIAEFRSEIAPDSEPGGSEEEFGIEQIERSDFHLSPEEGPLSDRKESGGRERRDGIETPFCVEFSLDGSTTDISSLSFDGEDGRPARDELWVDESRPAEDAPEEDETGAGIEPASQDDVLEPVRGERVRNAEEVEDGKDVDRPENIEAALLDGRMDEAWELLSAPCDDLDGTTRKLLLARYHILNDSPLEAVCVLKSIETDALPPPEAREVLLKLASCYRELHRYDAAHAVLLKILSQEPSCREAREMAKRNYSDYLKQHADCSITLEKTYTISKNPEGH